MYAFEEDLNYQLIQVMKEHRQRAEEALNHLGLHVSQELVLFVHGKGAAINQQNRQNGGQYTPNGNQPRKRSHGPLQDGPRVAPSLQEVLNVGSGEVGVA